jgi:hypothetical protein
MTAPAVQKEYVKRLEWVIWFSQVNLRSLSEGDRNNARARLYDFVQYSRQEPGVLKGPAPSREYGMDLRRLCKEANEKDISRVQSELKLRLLGFVCIEEAETKSLPPTPVGDSQFLPIKNGIISAYGSRPDEPFEWQIQWNLPANLQTSAVTALFRHLVSSRILWSQLRICPQCQRIFLLGRKPRPDKEFHCSLRCSRNAATRRYRERQAREKGEEVRAKERARSHNRYSKRQKIKFGPKVKVARRPRKRSGTKKSSPQIEFVRGTPVSSTDPGQVGPW